MKRISKNFDALMHQKKSGNSFSPDSVCEEEGIALKMQKKSFVKKLMIPFVFIVSFLKSLWNAFKNGDAFTKSSFLLMGIANLFNKQVVKGIIYLSIQL